MSAPHIDLARQLVASPHWRWMAGMLVALRTTPEGGPKFTIGWFLKFTS